MFVFVYEEGAQGRQRTDCRSWFSPSDMWPQEEPQVANLEGKSAFTHWAILPTPDGFVRKIFI